jgi:hypothetical protein
MVKKGQTQWQVAAMQVIESSLKIKVTVKLRSLILALFFLNYGFFGFGLPWNSDSFSGLFNMTRITAFVLTVIASLLIIEWNQSRKIEFIEISLIQLILALSLTASALLIRESLYLTYMSGDELAYLSNSIHHTLKLASMLGNLGQGNASGDFIEMLTLQKMSGLGLIILAFCSTWIYIFIKISKKYKFATLLITFIALRLINDYFFHFSFQYLNGYAIPLAPITGISSNDLPYRLTSTFVFFLVIIVGIGRINKLKAFVVVFTAFFFALLFDFFGNFILVLETTMYFACFGTVVLYRLIRKEQFSMTSTLWIATISVHFRPTNIIWVALCFTLLAATHRKDLKKMLEFLPQIALVAPFLIDSVFRTLLIVRGGVYSEADNQYFYPANEYQLMAMSFLQSFSIEEIVILVGLLIALLLREKTVLPVLLYALWVLALYIPLIPKSTLGQSKYIYELFIPVFLSLILILFQNISLSNWKSNILASAIVATSFFASFNNPNEEYVFKVEKSKIIQSPGYIIAPLAHKISMQSQNAISNEEYCVNPSPIYGDAYYLLRNETSFERERRREIEQFPIFPLDPADLVRKEGQPHCLIVDSMLIKHRYANLLAGWHRIYVSSDAKFDSVFEIWLKPKGGEGSGA